MGLYAVIVRWAEGETELGRAIEEVWAESRDEAAHEAVRRHRYKGSRIWCSTVIEARGDTPGQPRSIPIRRYRASAAPAEREVVTAEFLRRTNRAARSDAIRLGKARRRGSVGAAVVALCAPPKA
jgi:hypothetical protein